MMLKDKTFDVSSIVRGVIAVAVIVALYFLVNRLSGVLLPFVISWVIAYMLVPIVSFFQYKCRLKSRFLSVMLTLLLVLGVLAGMVALLVPMVVSQVETLSLYVQEYVAHFNASEWLTPEMEEMYKSMIGSLDLQALLQNDTITSALKQIVPTVGGWVASGMSVLGGMMVVFVCLLYIIFILLDHEKLSASWPTLIPIDYRERAKMMMRDLDQSMNAYFRGQALVAGIVGILFAIGFLIIGLPMGVAVGLLIGVLNLVPYLQVAGIPVCVLLGIVQSAETGRPIWVVMLCILAVFAVVQTLQDMVLVPKIQGKAMGMNPAMILLSLSVWGALFGFIGLIIALPMTTLLVSYYKRFVLHDANGNGIPDELEVQEETEAGTEIEPVAPANDTLK